MKVSGPQSAYGSRSAALVTLCLVGAAAPLSADQPLWESPFAVNEITAGDQNAPAVAPLPDGRFVVAWNGPGADGAGVFVRIFDADGQAPPEQLANTYTTGSQRAATVAAAPGGELLVSWASYGQDGDGYGIFARAYTGAGEPVDPEFQVNATTEDSQYYPSVAGHDDGFVVVWQDQTLDGNGYGVVGRRLALDGSSRGGEFQVNSYTFVGQSRPAVAATPDGRFVVVWQDQTLDGDEYGIFARRFTAEGLPEGVEVQVNEYTTGPQRHPDVKATAEGDFVVVWQSFGQEGSDYSVHGRIFGADGTPETSEFRLSETGEGFHQEPAVELDAGGRPTVTWVAEDSDNMGVFVRRFSATGEPYGGDHQANVFVAGRQSRPAVASLDTGGWVLVWLSDDEDGDGRGLVGREALWVLFADGFEGGDTAAWSVSVP